MILTTTINEIIKLRWVALGPRNYGKSIEWKLEGDPWDTEGMIYTNFIFCKSEIVSNISKIFQSQLFIIKKTHFRSIFGSN